MRIAPTRFSLGGGLVTDVRVGIRRLGRRPWFAAIAVASIAVSTAALAAMFSVLNATELRSLPYAAGERLSILYTRHDSSSSSPGSDGPSGNYAALTEYRRRLRSFDRLEGVSVVTKRVDVDGTPGDALTGRAATPGFLSMLSVRPLLGRWIADYDTIAGAERVIVLSHSFWSANYGGDAGIVGKRIALRDRFPFAAPANNYLVIGVLPSSFVWDQRGVFWVPISASEPQTRMSVSPIGLLRSGVSMHVADEEARAVGRDLAGALEQTRPPGDKSLGGKLEVRATPLWDYLHERVGGKAGRLALFGLAFSVLVLAVANVLSLSLLDAQARRLEFAVRRALGASRRRVARQTLIEAGVLSVPASLVGLVVSPPLIRLTSEKLKLTALGVAPSLDGTAVIVTTIVGFLIAVVLGLAPGMVYASRDFTDGTAVRGIVATTRRVRASHGLLVVVESAMAIVVLTGAGLVVKELNRLGSQELGYAPDRLAYLAAPIGPPRPSPEVVARGNDAVARLRAIPGVTGVAVAAADLAIQLRSDIAPTRLPPTAPRAVFDVTPDYFSLLQIPVVRGRLFAATDDASHPDVAILSVEAARRLFPAVDPIGRKLALTGMGPGDIDTWTTVIGVVGDARVHEDPINPRQAIVYRPFDQGRPFTLQLIARGSTAGSPTYATFRDAVRPLGEGPTAQWTVSFLEDDVRKYLATPRFTAVSLTSLAVVGLSLALVGIFGVTAYSVTVRTREIAIRVALGAKAQRIVAAIVRESVMFVILGVFVGIVLSAWMGRLMQPFLHGASPFDGTVYVVAPLVLLGTTFIACLIPARRALTIDPARALRFE